MVTRIGEVYEASSESKYRYFQFIALDEYQLNSDVIAVFEGVYDSPQDYIQAMSKTVDYYSHTTISAGIPELWRKVGKEELIAFKKKDIYFKTVDSDKDDRESYEGMSDHWRIWNLEDEHEYIGSYDKVPENAELGLVFNPKGALRRMFHGEYDFVHGYYGAKR